MPLDGTMMQPDGADTTKPPAFSGPEFADIRSRCDRAITTLRSERSPFFTMWRELSQFIIPQRGRFVMPPGPNDTLRGLPKQQQIIDRTATKALKAMAAFLMAGITSPARDWFKLATLRDELNDDHDVKAWLSEVAKRQRTIFTASNFYNAMASLYEELGAFGTGVMLCLPDYENVMRFTTLTAGEYLLLTDKCGMVNTVYREMVLNVQAMVEEFGLENVSERVRSLYIAKNFSYEINVVHAIIPNVGRKIGRMDWRGMEFLSVRYEQGFASFQCLDVAGFHEFPAIAPRWDVVATDVYGHGPAEEALPDVKMLQILRRRQAEAIDKMVKPPMVGPASLKNSLVQLIPGGMNYVDPQAVGGMKPAFDIPPNGIQPLAELVADTRQTIQGTFYGDLIAQFSQGDTPDMTAREVDERHEEKVLLLGPMLERFHAEGLSPVLAIVFNRMARVGLLPPAPAALKGQHVEPEFISLLAQAQRAVGTTSIEQLFRFAGGLVAVVPNAMDNLDVDKAIEAYADMTGVTPEIVRDPAKVAAMRQAQQQQEAAAQAAQQGQAAVQAAQTLSQTDVGGGANALQLMAGTN
jgi:hypothetical protein